MNSNSSSPNLAKYAWYQIDREDRAKRPAEERVHDFGEIYGTYDEATVIEQASRCIQCGKPTCMEACPLESPIADLLALTADGRLEEAAQLLCASHSLPELFARICLGGHPCERACLLAGKSEPIPIGAISAFLLDYAWRHNLSEPPLAPDTGRRVAVIGSGICGMVGADALSRLGHSVTVIDSREKPGGRMVNGLPGFRVDTGLIERRVHLLKERGVRFNMGVACGRDVKLSVLRREYDAVFLALGRAEAIPLHAPGADLRGVEQAYTLLQQTKHDPTANHPLNIRARKVVVLGAGDTAMDTLRTAVRAEAAEVTCIYRRDAANMPAIRDEYENAQEEGARFIFLAQPVAIIGNAAGEVTHVRCVRMELTAPEADKRLGVRPISGSEFDVPADVVLVAFGFETPRLPKTEDFAELESDDNGRLVVDVNQMTRLPGVFAGGSIVQGSVPLTQIVRDARKTVAAIDHYLAALPKRR